MPEPLRVVLTGGPCGGKTAAIKLLTEHYRSKGHPVYAAPEIPTLLHSTGVNLVEKMSGDPTAKRTIRNRTSLLRGALNLQVAMEDVLYSMADDDNSPDKKRPICLFDRGVSDFRAYYLQEMWDQVATILQIDRDYEYYCYDLVLHLTTAAIGAEAAFNNDNPARQCTPDLAKQLDEKTRNAWQRPVIVVDNSTDFLGKIQRLIKHIDDALITNCPC